MKLGSLQLKSLFSTATSEDLEVGLQPIQPLNELVWKQFSSVKEERPNKNTFWITKTSYANLSGTSADSKDIWFKSCTIMRVLYTSEEIKFVNLRNILAYKYLFHHWTDRTGFCFSSKHGMRGSIYSKVNLGKTRCCRTLTSMLNPDLIRTFVLLFDPVFIKYRFKYKASF